MLGPLFVFLLARRRPCWRWCPRFVALAVAHPASNKAKATQNNFGSKYFTSFQDIDAILCTYRLTSRTRKTNKNNSSSAVAARGIQG